MGKTDVKLFVGDLFYVQHCDCMKRITNYLFQDDEENFDDLFRMKYNLVRWCLLLSFFFFLFFAVTFFCWSFFSLMFASFCVFAKKLSINIWVQSREVVADFDSEKTDILCLARKNYVLEKLDSRKILWKTKHTHTRPMGRRRKKKFYAEFVCC